MLLGYVFILKAKHEFRKIKKHESRANKNT